MNDHVIGYAITLGIALAGASWALVFLVAKIVRLATRIELQLETLSPRVSSMEATLSTQGIAITRLDRDVQHLDERFDSIAERRRDRPSNHGA